VEEESKQLSIDRCHGVEKGSKQLSIGALAPSASSKSCHCLLEGTAARQGGRAGCSPECAP
jgi:hypothetical protein